MKVRVLGGGSEVGASCLHIEIADTSLLIDAGMRMHGDDPLPSLGMLEDVEKLDAILVTHAHADHIGALPIVHSLYPHTPIYTMPPTADLMNIMMKDSFKILEQRCLQTNSLPPYTQEQVNSLLESIQLLPATGVLTVGNVKITSYRAGHILGAVMFLLEGDGEKILVTGDLSFQAGRTIPGAKVPHHINPDVVIMESTYGNRAHTDRNTEEKRLANDIAQIISNGGFALIPAFALGRAQEVLLILQDYMEKGLIPEFPIYVDGLVTPISRIYKNYPHFLKGPVAYRIKNNGDAFLTEGRCKAVSPKERAEVLKGKPGCIVASSGMLIGGASTWYAEKLISHEKNAIFITGYQDEESPGKKLLDVAEEKEQQLELSGTSYPVKCQIGKYGLSAHADSNEMTRFIESLNPTYTLLVHGDDDARSTLASKIDQRYHPTLVENGETYPFEKRSSGQGIKGKRSLRSTVDASLQEKVGQIVLYQKLGESPLKAAICTGVHQKTKTLFCQTLKGKQIKLQLGQTIETDAGWNRSMEELTEAVDQVFTYSRPYLKNIDWNVIPNQPVALPDIYQYLQVDSVQQQLAVCLALYAVPDENKRREGEGKVYYTLDDKVKQQLKKWELPIQGILVNPAKAMDFVREMLKEHPRFMRCGVDNLGTRVQRLTIYFDFPDAVSEEERKLIADTIMEKTGWVTTFSDSVRQDLLQSKVSELVGSLNGALSIYLTDRQIAVPLSKPVGAPAIIEQFFCETGFRLIFLEDGAASSQPIQEKTVFQSLTKSNRMENNQAIEEAKKWAQDREITVYKYSLKQEVMEIHFISPEVAKMHERDLEELSYRIGMPVTYAKNPKQNEIIQFVSQSIPPNWQLKKNPSIHIEVAQVAVKVAATMPSEKEIEIVNNSINQVTGYSLKVMV
ncbi:MAG: MBL fold metallo-hydrolase [Bacillus sp. (in: firmicutes)]